MPAVKRTRKKVNVGKCYFCENKATPDYKDVETLEKFITDRAKIIGSEKTGICTKHQRHLAREIKRARHLSLLPYTEKIT